MAADIASLYSREYEVHVGQGTASADVVVRK
jgi:hypothetical protein